MKAIIEAIHRAQARLDEASEADKTADFGSTTGLASKLGEVKACVDLARMALRELPEAIAAAIAQAVVEERKACADVADDYSCIGRQADAERIAEAIRARK